MKRAKEGGEDSLGSVLISGALFFQLLSLLCTAAAACCCCHRWWAGLDGSVGKGLDVSILEIPAKHETMILQLGRAIAPPSPRVGGRGTRQQDKKKRRKTEMEILYHINALFFPRLLFVKKMRSSTSNMNACKKQKRKRDWALDPPLRLVRPEKSNMRVFVG